MKRDSKSDLFSQEPSEVKQEAHFSLTKTALQLLEQQAHEQEISVSELIEKLVCDLKVDLDRTAVVREKSASGHWEPIADAFVALDRYCRYTYISPEALDLLRKSYVDLIGQPLEEIFPESCNTPLTSLCQQAIAQQTRTTFEGYYPPGNIWLEIHIYPSPKGLSLYFRDISDRQRHEEELHCSEQRFKTLAENAPDIISRVDREFRHLYVSPAIEAATGLCPEAFIGKTNAELGMPEAMYRQWHEILEQVFVTGQGRTTEFEFSAPDGIRYFQSRLVPEFARDGSVVSVLGIARDVTEYKQVEQALRQSEACFRRIFECSMLGMAFFHRDGRLLEVNDALLDQLGYQREEFIDRGLRWTEISAPEYKTLDDRAFQQALEDGYCKPYEKEFIRQDGSRICVLAGGCLFDGSNDSGVFYTIDLTECKQATQAQQEAEERLRVAVRHSPLTVFNQDSELRYTWIYNPSLNLSTEDALGKRDEDLIAPEDAQVLTALKRRVLETGLGQREEVKITMQGRDWHFDLIVEPLLNAGGEAIGVTCAAIDISDRKQAEVEREQLLMRERIARQEAERTQQQLTAIFETSPVGIAFLDGERRYVAINEALAQINGLNQQQHLGRTVAEIFRASDPDIVKLVDNIYTTGKPFIASQWALNAPGRDDRRPGYYNLHYLPLHNSRGEVEGSLAYVLDITERIELEQGQAFLSEASAVLASSLDYQVTLERVAQLTVPNLADWCTVHLVEEDGTIEQLAIAHINPAKVAWAKELAEKYPLDPDEPRGAGFTLRTGQSDLISDIPDEMLVEAARDPEHLNILRQVGFKSVMTVALQTPEKILGVISFISAESGRRYDWADLSLAQELAHRASLAIDNARLYRGAQRDRARAEAANRIKDEFLAVLSHELRTPLNPILGWSKLLRLRQFDAVTTLRALETIERNAKLQTQLIEDLLDISRILQGKLRLNVASVDLVATIEAALETVRLSAEAKAIEINQVFEPNIGLVLGDASRLQQVVWNLLSNAIKFTPHGGRVEVRLEKETPCGLIPSSLLHPPSVRIQVQDTGRGLTPEFLPYAFDCFRQADSSSTRQFGGLGLGLAIVRHIVELHGGTVAAESAGEGKGATFTISLPLVTTKPQPSPPETTSDPIPALKGVRVLAVDDEPDMRELTSFLLKQAQADVTVVSSAPEVLEMLASFKPDILLTDIGMPNVDGYMLLQQIRALSPAQGGQIPAIALTAYAGELNQEKALTSGFQMHLSKPIDPQELVVAIASLLKHR